MARSLDATRCSRVATLLYVWLGRLVGTSNSQTGSSLGCGMFSGPSSNSTRRHQDGIGFAIVAENIRQSEEWTSHLVSSSSVGVLRGVRQYARHTLTGQKQYEIPRFPTDAAGSASTSILETAAGLAVAFSLTASNPPSPV